MKKTFAFIVLVLFVISAVGTAYATTNEASTVAMEELGVHPLSETEFVASLELSAGEPNICENVIQNVTVPAVKIPGNHVLSDLVFDSETGIVPYATTSFSFDGLAGDTMASDWILYTIDDSGDTVLHVSSCTWIPSSYKIVIGLWQLGTADLYGVEYESTNVINVDLTTKNLPAGNYYVVVKNMEASNLTISDGILSYSIS